MTDTTSSAATPARIPYRIAVIVFAVVLAGYLYTLAPSVTFWDAGELIAAAKILGIPHPPGTPLFVLMGHVWAALVPLGGFAYRTNVLTAICSAAAAGFFFLLIAQALRGRSVGKGAVADVLAGDRVFIFGGAVAAALTSAFTFTVWQNSNETEVYMLATFSIAAVSWLAWEWRKHRGAARAPHVLLLVVYLMAVSLGAHLLTLLVGPALIGFMWHVLRTEPLPTERDRRIEWAQWAVVIGVWALLTGVGLGSTLLLVVGGLVFVGAAVYAAGVGALAFALTVLAIAVVGASTYLFLLYRARVGPVLNEADPATWQSLWAVIRRAQYPPRSPIDNPIYTSRAGSAIDRVGAFLSCLPQFVSGPVPSDQAGFAVPRCYTVRSIPLMLRQAQNYLQYFDWQWADGLAPFQPVFARVRVPITLVAIALGTYGAGVLRRRDRSVFWLLVLLFLTTGPVLAGYMNFKPGFSLAWNRYPNMEMHEVRERDYFFTVSFQVWGLFVGVGLAGMYRLLRDALADGPKRRAAQLAPTALFALALAPFVLNFRAASRAHGPDAHLPRDFAYDLLQSVEPYGIVFTNGDNDTFPLWYLQEVEGIRQDVAVVNLSLANTDWYIRQLRDNPVRRFDPSQAAWYAPVAPREPPGPLLSLSDAEIAALRPMMLPQALSFSAGNMTVTYPKNTPLYVHEMIILRLIQENWRQRPIYFSLTSGTGNWTTFRNYVTQQALVFRLYPGARPDSSRLAAGLFGVALDVPRTDSLLWDVYRYGDLFRSDSLALDPTNRNIAINLSFPFYGLGQAYELRGEREKAMRNVRRALVLRYIPEVATVIDSEERSLAPPDSAGVSR